LSNLPTQRFIYRGFIMSVSVLGKTHKELLELRSKITAQAKQYIAENESSWNWKNDDAHAKMVKDIAIITEAMEKQQAAFGGKISLAMMGDPMESPSRSASRSFGQKSKGVQINEKATIFRSTDSLVETFGKAEFGLADMIRAKVLGDTASLGESVGSEGGYLTSMQVSSTVLDLARAKSVLTRAGMQMITTSESSLRIPRLVADPTFQIKNENQEFVEDTQMEFGAIQFFPILLGTYISVSRELVEDAPNFTSVVEESIASAFAVQMDRLPLLGMVSGRTKVGLLDDSDIAETGSTGTLTFGKLAAGATTIRTANHEPNAILLHPSRRDAVLDSVSSGSGEYLGIPPSLANVMMMDSTNIPIDRSLIGNFTRLLFVTKGGPYIESTQTGGDSFKKHQIHIKLYHRCDFGVSHYPAFRRLAGIS
jgi:HK97 family phage major capsid protein